MELTELKAILEFMNQNHLVEFEVEENGRRIRLRRAEDRLPAPGSPPAAAPAASSPPPGPAPASESFKAPLVGTFYRSPKPGAPPFVNAGDEIKTDDVLCVIEAMKVMNEIKAPFDARVAGVLAKDGQAVEFGAPLFLLEKK